MMSSHGLCCERRHETPSVHPPPGRGGDPPRLPGLPAPRREGPLARRLAAVAGRRPQPGRGGPARRPVRRGRPGGAAPLEPARARWAGRPAQGQRAGAQPGRPPLGRPGPRGGAAAARRRVVDRPEAGPLRRRPLGRPRVPRDRLAVATQAGADPPGPPAAAPALGVPRRAAALGKNLRRRLGRLRRAHPGKAVEVWAEDESRFGLKPVMRRVWAPRGQRPLCSGRARYEWLYLYGFARPRAGALVALALPRVTAEHMGEALASFAQRAEPEGRKVLVVLLDNAGWHTAKRLVVPANVVLHRLPPCTPELQPAEPLWPLVREAVANREFEGLAQLRAAVRRRCAALARRPEVVQGAVGFHWAMRLES